LAMWTYFRRMGFGSSSTSI